ncbi:MAG TPA: aminopeptidase [Polyangia bacterium]
MRGSSSILGAALVALLAAGAGGCWTSGYLAQQGEGQLRLLRARRPITAVLADPGVDSDTKRRLRVALAARDFGTRVLGLRRGGVYTRYLDTHGAPVAWMVAAAPKDRLAPHLFRFPLVGAMPYAGFFREADAAREQARLAALGLDTYVRPVAGYSTLGITSDPVYSSMLEGSDARIVEITLHEMAHATAFWPGHADWNESFATFVGVRGAALFFAAGGRGDAVNRVLTHARLVEQAEARFAAFLTPVIAELRALYARPISRAEKLQRREEVFARARAAYLRTFPPRPGRAPGAFASAKLNNAVIMAFAVYHQHTPEHRRVFERTGGDLGAFIALCKHAVEEHRDVQAYLRRY